MISKRGSKSIEIFNKVYNFDQSIANVIEHDGFIVVHLDTDDYSVGDPMVGRNILGFDSEGNQVWRVEDHGYTIGKDQEKRVPQSFMSVWRLSESGKLKAGIVDVIFTLDAKTGKLSEPEWDR